MGCQVRDEEDMLGDMRVTRPAIDGMETNG